MPIDISISQNMKKYAQYKWEFLRRNHEYIEDCNKLDHQVKNNSDGILSGIVPIEHVITFYSQLKDLIEERGKKGVNIQRFKGLGEMMPQQLWETTMDPLTRTLLRVDIEDAAMCDTLFDILMGERVEPRREFIEKNAMYVKNLDV